jgi:hypothetical protein
MPGMEVAQSIIGLTSRAVRAIPGALVKELEETGGTSRSARGGMLHILLFRY